MSGVCTQGSCQALCHAVTAVTALTAVADGHALTDGPAAACLGSASCPHPIVFSIITAVYVDRVIFTESAPTHSDVYINGVSRNSLGYNKPSCEVKPSN